MIIYDQTTIAFIRKAENFIREILIDLQIEIKRSRFLYKDYLYPISLVAFEGTELGHFNAPYLQIGLNKKLVYLAKDSVLRDILKHELAHYLTYIEYGQTSPHGPEFRKICERFGFSHEISSATVNLHEANESKEGDLVSEKVLEKVKKLLQLAQSSNEHEAELATIKANALLLRHNLDHVSDTTETIYLEKVLHQKRKDSKMVAIYDILKHFIVRPVISHGRGACCLEVSGSLTNVKLACYVAEFLDREFEHLWELSKKEHQLQGLRAKNSFFSGIAKGFNEKMERSKMQFSPADQRALVKVEKELHTRIRQIYGRLSHSRSEARMDEVANSLGVQKGKNLTIRQGVESTIRNLFLT